MAYCQGYLCLGSGSTVRVRTCGCRGYITVKGAGAGMVRREFEYEIPFPDAKEMLEEVCAKPLIVKDRYRIVHKGFTWEVDLFHGANEGLVIAEIELETPEQVFPLPEWIGREVTGDPRYFNASLVKYPYSQWKEE